MYIVNERINMRMLPQENRQQVVVLLFLSLLIGKVNTDGVISVKFIRYENKEGTGANGHCCDGRWPFCEPQGCDHQFVICLDDVNSGNKVDQCKFGRMQTYEIKNKNINNFVDDPSDFDVMGAMPISFSLKVDVTDYDSLFSDDEIDFLRKDITTFSNQMDTDFILESRTWLSVQVSTKCSQHFYGRTCESFCQPPKRGDHYKCDLKTGEKHCHHGWIGPDCQTAPCNNYKCENGGTCDVTAHGRPLCICTSNFTGPQCETNKCELICQPGKCIIENKEENKFLCKCEKENGEAIYGEGKPCPFELSTASPPTTPAPSWNNDCNAIIQDRINGPDSRGINGVYKIHPPGGDEFEAYCDMMASADGWTLIQRRQNGIEDFFRGWEDYKKGFGKLDEEEGEFWLGLEKIYRLTSYKSYKLRVVMVDYFGDIKYADYKDFYIEGEKEHFKLHVSGYSGDAGDALSITEDDNTTVRHHDGMPFSTYDHDQDASAKYNCAQLFQSGWWFSSCLRSNLNGVYRKTTGEARCCAYQDRCVTWQTINRLSLKKVEMKIIPNKS